MAIKLHLYEDVLCSYPRSAVCLYCQNTKIYKMRKNFLIREKQRKFSNQIRQIDNSYRKKREKTDTFDKKNSKNIEDRKQQIWVEC